MAGYLQEFPQSMNKLDATPNEKGWLSVADAAKMSVFSTSTIYRWVREDLILSRKKDGRIQVYAPLIVPHFASALAHFLIDNRSE